MQLSNDGMNYDVAAYFRSARELNLPVKVVKEIGGFQLKLGTTIYFFRSKITPFNNAVANEVANNKYCANKILEKAGIPVPKGTGITKQEFDSNSWNLDGLKFPLVIKPTVGSCWGIDVLCNIKDHETLQFHLNSLFKKYNVLSIEEFHGGLVSYRVLVFYGKVIGIVKRIPAQVVGDGKHNILELIARENKARLILLDKIHGLSEIHLDEESNIILNELKLTLQDIPMTGIVISLRYTCNLFRGGTLVLLGKQICKENAELACKAARVLGLNLVGFDLLCEDINIPVEKSSGVFIEANFNPDVTIHECKLEGELVQTSKIIMSKFIYKHPFLYVINYIKQKFQSMFSRSRNLKFFNIINKLQKIFS